MGFHPLFSLNCRRRSGLSGQALAPHQAKPGLFSGGVSSNKGTSCKQVSPAGIQRLRLARHSGCPRNPVSTGSIANLEWRICLRSSRYGRLGSNCNSRNLFSRQQKPAPEMRQRQPETVTETLCEVAPQPAEKWPSAVFLRVKPLTSPDLHPFPACSMERKTRGWRDARRCLEWPVAGPHIRPCLRAATRDRACRGAGHPAWLGYRAVG